MCTVKNIYILTHNFPHKDSIDFLVFQQRRWRANIYEEEEKSRYQKFCKSASNNYQGENHCAFNVGEALIKAKQFLS